MTEIAYFKRQAKNLFRDYKTKKICNKEGYSYYKYSPKFFDIDNLFLSYDIDETDFCLMKAQHLIALLAGFEKWGDLLNASKKDLELAKILFDNQDKISVEDWELYIFGAESDNNVTFDAASKIEIFKHVILQQETFYEYYAQDFLLKQNSDTSTKASDQTSRES